MRIPTALNLGFRLCAFSIVNRQSSIVNPDRLSVPCPGAHCESRGRARRRQAVASGPGLSRHHSGGVHMACRLRRAHQTIGRSNRAHLRQGSGAGRSARVPAGHHYLRYPGVHSSPFRPHRRSAREKIEAPPRSDPLYFFPYSFRACGARLRRLLLWIDARSRKPPSNVTAADSKRKWLRSSNRPSRTGLRPGSRSVAERPGSPSIAAFRNQTVFRSASTRWGPSITRSR